MQAEAAAFWTPMSEVERWRDNPRRNEAAVPGVARSIRKFGFISPCVVWGSRDRLVAGHTRLLAMDKLLAEDPSFVPRDAPGPGLVPVRYCEFRDEAEAAAFAIADNKLSEVAQWDESLLGQVLAEIGSADEALLAETGFGSEEIDRLIAETQGGAEPETPEPGDAPAPSEALQEKWGTESGQLWVAGPHRVLCGDCRRPEDVDRLLGERRAMVAITSPPYAQQRGYDPESGFRPVPPDEYVDWFEAVQAGVRAHLAPGGSWLVNIKPHSEDGQRVLYVADLLVAHVRRWHWSYIDELCWVRAGVPGAWPNRFKNAWEPVYHFAVTPRITFKPEAVSTPTDHAFGYSADNSRSVSGSGLLGKRHAAGFHAGLARPSNVIEVGSGGGQVSGQHPAEFPVGLPRWLMLAFSNAGDVVYEPFAGSGATLLAAAQTGRVGCGMEISPMYLAVTLERLSQLGLEPCLEEDA